MSPSPPDKPLLEPVAVEALINSIPDALVFADPQHRIQMVNPAMEILFGYTTDELVGQTTEILYQSSDDCPVLGEIHEMSYRHRSGKVFDGETTSVPVKDATGNTIGLLSIIRNVAERERADEAIEQAHSHFHALHDASPDMIFLHADDGSLVEVNDNALSNFGYTREEMLARTVVELSGKSFSQAEVQQRFARALAGENIDFNWTARRKDGSEFPAEVRLRRFSNGAGLHGATVLAVVRDISALHFAATVLKREQDLSSAVLDTIGSVVVVLNRSGQIVSFNQAAQSISGYSGEEAVGRRVWDFLLADDEREGVEDVFARLAEGDFPCKYENSWLTRDGESRRMVWNNSALVDKEGRVEYVIATGIDITEQRRAERDLARVETEWNKAIEFFADPIFLVGLDDRVIRANLAFFSMIGKPPSKVIGHDISAIMYPDGEAVPCHVCAARRERKDADIVLEEDHPDNPVGRPIEVTLRVIRDEHSKPVGILMGIRDLTRQRQIEAELRQHRDHLEELVQQRTAALESVNRELESFSYSVSHDLRAPLRSIDGFSHALLEDYNAVLDETGLGYLHRVRKASQRMGQLIDDLLQLSRVGRDAMECRQIDLSKLASSVVRLLREGDSEREMDVYIQDDMKTFGDPRLLRLLLENLLGNAWKFTSPRTVGEISFGVTNRDGRQEFFVRDNGIGFDMKYADKLFGPFQRLHSDTDFAGTGIGLATVYRIVKRHEGNIRAASEPDKGATFYFSFGLGAGEPASQA